MPAANQVHERERVGGADDCDVCGIAALLSWLETGAAVSFVALSREVGQPDSLLPPEPFFVLAAHPSHPRPPGR